MSTSIDKAAEYRTARNILITLLLVIVLAVAVVVMVGPPALGLIGLALTLVTFALLLGFTASR